MGSLNKLIPMNPTIPRLYGLPKTHKINCPIRPVVSNINSPTYFLGKWLNNYIKNVIDFRPKFGISNSNELIQEISKLELQEHYMLVSLDVKDLYTNIPTEELPKILRTHMQVRNFINEEIEIILSIMEHILSQSSFTFNNEFYAQETGLSMGAPTSAILADLYMDYYERKFFYISGQFSNNIKFYRRYVDDTILIWDGDADSLLAFINCLNSFHPNIQFTHETEENRSLNYLDLTITRNFAKGVDFKIYRKPTQTDLLINTSSNHPFEHKLSGIRSHIQRLFTVPMAPQDLTNEINIIKQLASKNGFEKHIVDKLIREKRRASEFSCLKWDAPPRPTTSMSFIGPISKKLQHIMRKHNIVSALRAKNQIKNYICNAKDKIPRLQNSGIYKLKCDNCDSTYIGETGRSINVRIREHLRNVEKSNFGRHLHSSEHHFNNIARTEILHKMAKGLRMTILEALEIDRDKKRNEFNLNDQTQLHFTPIFRQVDFSMI